MKATPVQSAVLCLSILGSVHAEDHYMRYLSPCNLLSESIQSDRCIKTEPTGS